MNDKKVSLNYNRIEYLLNPDQFKDIRLTIVGLGSGGAPVCDHLTMNGIQHWDLYDYDNLEPINLVKHPRTRKDIGRPKVEIQKEWIIDRNPRAIVNIYNEDVMSSANFDSSIKKSDLILSCPDKKSVREFINDKCVIYKKPSITASVFRTGIGGEIYAYIPNETGCYKCLQLFSILNDININLDMLDLTKEEKKRIYGLNEREFVASGLSIDIQTISLIQARMALSILLRGKPSIIPHIKSNWIVFGNRPAKGIFRNHFEVKQMLLKPQTNCICTMVSEEKNLGDNDN